PEVMAHHKKLHEEFANKATNPVSRLHHRKNAELIHNHLMGMDKLKKQDAMATAATSIQNAFGGGQSSAPPPPPPPPPPPAPASSGGSLSDNITAGLKGLMGKSESSNKCVNLINKIKKLSLQKNEMMGYGAQSMPQLP